MKTLLTIICFIIAIVLAIVIAVFLIKALNFIIAEFMLRDFWKQNRNK